MSENREKAILELDLEITQLKRNLTNASYLAQDIMEDYFEGIDASSKIGPALLAYEHPRYLSKMDVLQAILLAAKTEVEQLVEG